MCDLWDDGEPADVCNVSMPRARKPHQCDGCGGVIKPGTVYTLVKTLWEGRWDTARCCSPCIALASEFADAHGSYGQPHPDMLQAVIEECALEREDGWERWEQAVEAMRARRGEPRA